MLKTEEPEVRTNVLKLVEASLGASASTRPKPEEVKKYTEVMFNSMRPCVAEHEGLETWTKKFQQVVDTGEEVVKNALATVNATTSVAVVWEQVEIPVRVGSWDNNAHVQLMTECAQAPTWEEWYD